MGPSEGWEPATVGGGTGKTCPQYRNSVCLAQDMANFRVWTAGRNPGPERAQVGPTDTIWGQKLVKTQRKGSPNIARVDSIRERGRRTPSAPVLEQPGPVFWWFWAGLGPPRAWPVGARGGPPQAGDGDSGARGWLFGLPGAIWGAAERQRGALFAGPFWARRWPGDAGCRLLLDVQGPPLS